MNCGALARVASTWLTQSPDCDAILSHRETLPLPHQSRIVTAQTRDARFQRTDAAAADRHEARRSAGHFDQLVVARAPVADDPSDIDDVAAMNADKMPVVEPRFDITDSERAKQFVVAVEDVGVVRVGVDGDYLLDGKKVRFAVALDRQMPGKAPW